MALVLSVKATLLLLFRVLVVNVEEVYDNELLGPLRVSSERNPMVRLSSCYHAVPTN